MAGTWPELRARRWDWSRHSLAWLRREVFGIEEDPLQAEAAHVMVVGDSQAGKTTLLIRLLGVTEPEHVRETDEVLRAGRAKGNSATSVPIRYRWSSEADRWMLVRGAARHAEWLDSAQLRDLLAGFRSPDGRHLRWNPKDRPLEIGLPTRLAGAAPRHEMRVLDLPGLFAASESERQTAQAMVSRFAPVMNLIVFVHQVDKMADAFNDPAIRTNPHLADWTKSLDGFRVVLTRAFKDATVRRQLTGRLAAADPALRAPEAVAAYVRERLAEDLADSLGGLAAADDLAEILYPIDLGDSWQELRAAKPALADLAAPANELVVAALERSIEAQASEDFYYLSAPEAALRVAERIRYTAAERAAALDVLRGEVVAGQEELATAERVLDRAKDQHEQTTARLEQLRSAADGLHRRTVPYRRPAKPAMIGPEVRARQEDERQAWQTAGEELWHAWRKDTNTVMRGDSPFPVLPPLDERALRDRYNEEVNCCERCTESWFSRRWNGHQKPDHCYSRMGRAHDGMADWIQERLASGAESSLSSAEADVAEALHRRNAAQREHDRVGVEVERLAEDVLGAEREHTEQRAREERDLATASLITKVLNREARAQVDRTVAALAAAPREERGWYAVAALRTMLDLERMMRTA